MIGRIHGKLIEKHPPLLLIDVNGIGYELEAPMSTFYDLPQLGENVTLRTHFLVREDAQLLFGFLTEREREMFRELIKVSGIGAKVALSILSGMSVDELVHNINEQNITSLTRIPGIGKKTAERLTLEMRDRLKQMNNNATQTSSSKPATSAASCRDDAITALLALGYKANEADKMVSAVTEDGMDTETIIRNALKKMVKK